MSLVRSSTRWAAGLPALLLAAVTFAGTPAADPAPGKSSAPARSPAPTSTAPSPSSDLPVAPAWRIELEPPAPAPPAGVARAAEAARLQGSAPVLRQVIFADGSATVDLGDAFMEYAVARLGPSGRTQMACVHSLSEALDFIWGGVPLPAPASNPASLPAEE